MSLTTQYIIEHFWSNIASSGRSNHENKRPKINWCTGKGLVIYSRPLLHWDWRRMVQLHLNYSRLVALDGRTGCSLHESPRGGLVHEFPCTTAAHRIYKAHRPMYSCIKSWGRPEERTRSTWRMANWFICRNACFQLGTVAFVGREHMTMYCRQ